MTERLCEYQCLGSSREEQRVTAVQYRKDAFTGIAYKSSKSICQFLAFMQRIADEQTKVARNVLV